MEGTVISERHSILRMDPFQKIQYACVLFSSDRFFKVRGFDALRDDVTKSETVALHLPPQALPKIRRP
jgi:hypothetical protein